VYTTALTRHANDTDVVVLDERIRSRAFSTNLSGFGDEVKVTRLPTGLDDQFNFYEAFDAVDAASGSAYGNVTVNVSAYGLSVNDSYVCKFTLAYDSSTSFTATSTAQFAQSLNKVVRLAARVRGSPRDGFLAGGGG
jgi:hypothetical protein